MPQVEARTHLGLLHEGRLLKVGDSAEEAERSFVRPPTASTFKDLPPSFNPPYRARGWESASQSFGMLFFDNVLVFAMHTESGLAEADVDAALNSYIRTFGEPRTKLLGSRTRYYFWESNPHRLMLFSYSNVQKERYSLTVAIGDEAPMNALRMSPVDASEDRLAVEEPGIRHPG